MEEITLSLWRQETCVRWKAEWNGGAMQAFCQLTSVLATLLTTRLPHYEILCTRSKSNRRPPPPWFAKSTNGAIIVVSWDLNATGIVSGMIWSCTSTKYRILNRDLQRLPFVEDQNNLLQLLSVVPQAIDPPYIPIPLQSMPLML